MCGRFALHAHPQVVALQFGLAAAPELAPRYNIAPSFEVLIVRAADGARHAARARWGLVPHWAKDPAIGARLNNARAETLARRASFRDALRRRRCLIPASGFYEWQRVAGRSQPYYVYPSREALFAFAGLWERWRGPGAVLETCTVVTTGANAALRPIHDRMPVIVAPRDYARWLEGSSAGEVQALLRPCDPDDLVVRRVGRAVNDAGNESPRLIEEDLS